MPITRTVTLYEFDELSEEAQEAALCSLCEINVDHCWLDHIDCDAHDVGVKIEQFDIDHGTIKGRLNEYPVNVFKLIRKNHGKSCSTFKTARSWLKEYCKVFKEWREEVERSPDDFADWSPKDWREEFDRTDEAGEIENDFLYDLLEDYRLMLKREYEYQTSEEQVAESIRANGYLFNELGKIA